MMHETYNFGAIALGMLGFFFVFCCMMSIVVMFVLIRYIAFASYFYMIVKFIDRKFLNERYMKNYHEL